MRGRGLRASSNRDFIASISHPTFSPAKTLHRHFMWVSFWRQLFHLSVRPPVQVFCVTDNNFSISLRGYGWLQQEFIHKLRMPVYRADGKDILQVRNFAPQKNAHLFLSCAYLSTTCTDILLFSLHSQIIFTCD